MTDNAKSVIIAAGITVTVGIIGIALKPLWPFLNAIISGPGWLVYVYLGRITDSCLLVWVCQGIPQFLFIYVISISLISRPPFWQVRVGLMAFAWLVCSYIGYAVFLNVISRST